ncbi:CoF synthetase [Niallia taxi]|uniref:LuxE/PaaK family acyltransferase n=1 Tax=Niallia taxi TaxID=2499688 RepID=UPI002E1B8847|nr:CoF synthetase [Niallia taxi]MED4121757.1 CoF synthetase [Niallia taxi]
MKESAMAITNDILSFIDKYKEGIQELEEYEQDFNTLSLQLFNYQFQHNLPYKKYCQTKKRTPLTVKHWLHIPPMPIQGYKELTLSCEPADETEAVFMTSGTTNPEQKGRNYHPTLRVWDASMKYPFKQFVMPDKEKLTMLVLSPADDLYKNSSLSRYLSNAVANFGTEDSKFLFKENGLDMEELIKELQKCEQNQEPVLLIGATFAYVHILDYLQTRKLHFQLAEGSRIFDTGGFKGQSREIEMEELYQHFQTFFHVSRSKCINMYGMTELSSQLYDKTIMSSCNGEVIYDKTGPVWVRTVILDPETLKPVEKGTKGVIAHVDLANWNSCIAILTQDEGVQTDEGFQLLGRIKGSEARGCSIAVDQLMQAAQGGASIS